MQTYFEGEQASLFAPDTSAGRTFQARSVQAHRTGRILGSSWRKLLDYIAPDYQFLDLSADAGNLLGQSEWTIRSALHGGCWLRNSGPSPRDAIESFLSQILQAHDGRHTVAAGTALECRSYFFGVTNCSSSRTGACGKGSNERLLLHPRLRTERTGNVVQIAHLITLVLCKGNGLVT